MFGNKDEKRNRLNKLQQTLAEREVGATQLARELGVSRHTILDDIETLDKKGVKLCERKGKLSLLERWFKDVDGK
jgi:biotin operon repressor